MNIRQKQFPRGWNEERVRKVLAHYESQTDEEAVAEDEAAFEDSSETVTGISLSGQNSGWKKGGP